jgi:hypothetical protein
MYVGVLHRVKDPQAMLSRGEGLGDPSNAPAPRQFCPSKDLSAATCVWEADSIDTVRDYVDGTLSATRIAPAVDDLETATETLR